MESKILANEVAGEVLVLNKTDGYSFNVDTSDVDGEEVKQAKYKY